MFFQQKLFLRFDASFFVAPHGEKGLDDGAFFYTEL